MTVLTKKQITHLNNMNRAADDVSLGTMLAKLNYGNPTSGSYYTVTATDYSGSSGSIQTNFGTSNLHGAVINVVRAGSSIINPAYYNTWTASGSVIVTGSGAGCLLAGDIVRFICF